MPFLSVVLFFSSNHLLLFELCFREIKIAFNFCKNLETYSDWTI